MDYGKIVSTGWRQAWKHKTLWIFGFLIAGGGGGNVSQLSDDYDFIGLRQRDIYYIKDFINEHLYIIVLIGILALLALLIWIVLSKISIGGLIDAAGKFKRNEEYRFGKSFGVGVSFFWRLLGIGLLMFVVNAAFIIFLGLLGVAAFVIHVGLGVLSLLILLPLIIVGIFIVSVTVALAERYIVLEDRPVFEGIADGYNLWRANLGSAVLYCLIYVGIGIAVAIGSLVIFLFAVAPFVAIGFVNWLVAILVGAPIVLIILIVLSGFTSSALHLMTTEFYFQLREKSQPAVQPAAPGGGFAPPLTPPPDNPPPPPPPPVT
jgi:hypothetical protein